MSSPFPGMDPYLEDRHLWPSVHHRLISTISDMLTAQVAPHFYVTIEERVYITTPDEDDMLMVQILEPLEVRDHYIEVRDRSTRQVVTTIEVLSPRNKAAGSEAGVSSHPSVK